MPHMDWNCCRSEWILLMNRIVDYDIWISWNVQVYHIWIGIALDQKVYCLMNRIVHW